MLAFLVTYYFSDRGNCYFMGYLSPSTSMWQIIYLTNYVSPILIDNQAVNFNLSAWLGGVTTQDDNVVITLTFLDQSYQMVGNSISIGPVLAADRGSHTSLIPLEANGFVPIGARSVTLLVTITRVSGLQNNGDVDNILLYLYP